MMIKETSLYVGNTILKYSDHKHAVKFTRKGMEKPQRINLNWYVLRNKFKKFY